MESADREHQYLVLYSGGPDSYMTYTEVMRKHKPARVRPIYFNLGHRYLANELCAIGNTLPLTEIDGTFRNMTDWEEEDAHIFARNAVLLLGLARYVTGPATLYLSVQRDELTLADRQPIFLDAMAQVFGVLGLDVTVLSPWLYLDKTDMVKHYFLNGGSPSRLFATWSCYRPVGEDREAVHCGDCPACIRRYIAFISGLGEDGTRYAVHPKLGRTFQEYVSRALAGEYSLSRCQRILEAANEAE